MTINEMVSWNQHLQTPVLFNHHEPLQINSSTIKRIDLNHIESTPRAVSNHERILILTPLRNAEPFLKKHFELISELTYPHDLIDLAFLVGDSTDETLALLSDELDNIQNGEGNLPFRSALIVEKNFGVSIDMEVEQKHAYLAQGPRRKAMGRARNYLLYTALKPEHSWVYWRDVDINDSPNNILEEFVDHDRDILVPSMLPDSCFCKCEERKSADMIDRHLVPSLPERPRHRRQIRL
jgi:cellulose synthase/poly-beta-1,6-N-acetylglucosamine synthase-like glycosyltransferase